MNDISIFLFLLSVTSLFIVLYLFIRFVLSEKRSFTFEILSIPLGIFKFDKRDEFLKRKKNEANKSLDKSESENDETVSADKIETKNNDQTNSMITDADETDVNECVDIIEETANKENNGENEDKLSSQNDIIPEKAEELSSDSVNIHAILQEDTEEECIVENDSSIEEVSPSITENSESDTVNNDTKPSEYNTDILKKFEDEYNEEDDEDIVYWTASGKAYHTSKKCRTLSRSKVIFNGTIEDSGRFVKCIHCK